MVFALKYKQNWCSFFFNSHKFNLNCTYLPNDNINQIDQFDRTNPKNKQNAQLHCKTLDTKRKCNFFVPIIAYFYNSNGIHTHNIRLSFFFALCVLFHIECIQIGIAFIGGD